MDQIWQIIMLLILLEFVKTIKKSPSSAKVTVIFPKNNLTSGQPSSAGLPFSIYKYSKSAVKVKPQSTEMFCRIKNNRPRQR